MGITKMFHLITTLFLIDEEDNYITNQKGDYELKSEIKFLLELIPLPNLRSLLDLLTTLKRIESIKKAAEFCKSIQEDVLTLI